MSDSSSDSEDDNARFREVCDPTLPIKFNDAKESSLVKKNHPISLTDSKHLFDTTDDPRESFKLVNQVKKSVATFKSMKGWFGNMVFSLNNVIHKVDNNKVARVFNFLSSLIYYSNSNY